MMSPARRPGEDLHNYLQTLAENARPAQFLELRWPTADGWMRRQFFAAHHTDAAALRILQLGRCHDVYVGVVLRDTDKAGGKDAIGGSRFVYIESDHSDCERLLMGFSHRPTIEIASGSHGHRHLYWRLIEIASNEQTEAANRRMALRLGGDLGCVDVARILRPPETLNHKHDPPRAVRLLAYRPKARYTLAELTSSLPTDPCIAEARHATASTRRVGRTPLDRELLLIPAAEYVRVLAGSVANRVGKVLCPFHEDTDPSLQLYPDGTFYCFGCRVGGTIIDFAAALWGMGTKEEDFLELRKRLAETFALTFIASRS